MSSGGRAGRSLVMGLAVQSHPVSMSSGKTLNLRLPQPLGMREPVHNCRSRAG